MSARLSGALLVVVACVAAAGWFLSAAFLVATTLWLASLWRPAGARWVFLVALLVRVPFLFSEYHSNDLYRYVWEGRIQLAGYNPYAHAPDDPALASLRDANFAEINHPSYPTIYPPLAQALFAGLAALGLDERGVRAGLLGLDVLVVGVLLAWLRATGRPPGRAIVYAWCPVAVAGSVTGHVDPLMLCCLAACGLAWERGRPHAAAALLGGAILAKTAAVLCVPWLLLRRPRAALLAGGVVVAGYLPYLGGDLFGTLYAFGAEFAFNGSIYRVAEAVAPAHARLLVGVLLVAWTAVVTLTQPRIGHAIALVMAGLLLCSPTVHYWYLTWFLVALPAVGPRRWTLPLLVWTASAFFSGRTYHVHYTDGPFEEYFVLTAVEYGLPLLCALWLAWRAWPRRAPLAAAGGATVAGSYAVVVPCRGEFENLQTLVPRWLATPAERIVLADTPTGDGTSSLAGDRVAYVPVAERGYGAAVRAGLAAARDVDFVVVCDADHARGPDQAVALLAPFADPAVGLVAAARTDAAGQSLAQRWGNALVTFLIALGWGRRFHDVGPFRALRVAAWPEGALTDRGFGWNVEMNVSALERGVKVVEVGLPGSERRHGANRISGTLLGVVRTGYGILSRLYRLRERSCRPLSSS